MAFPGSWGFRETPVEIHCSRFKANRDTRATAVEAGGGIKRKPNGCKSIGLFVNMDFCWKIWKEKFRRVKIWLEQCFWAKSFFAILTIFDTLLSLSRWTVLHASSKEREKEKKLTFCESWAQRSGWKHSLTSPSKLAGL